MRLIDADVAIEELTDRSHQAAKRVGTDSPFWEGLVIARRIVNNLPTIQPEPTDEQVAEYCKRRCLHVVTDDFFRVAQPEPKEGRWIWVAGDLECSECHTRYPDLYPDYDNAVACPHCGAKMRKGEGEPDV